MGVPPPSALGELTKDDDEDEVLEDEEAEEDEALDVEDEEEGTFCWSGVECESDSLSSSEELGLTACDGRSDLESYILSICNGGNNEPK